MQRARLFDSATALLALALFAAACADNPIGVSALSDVVGTWDATGARFTVIEDPQQTAELIELGGAFAIIIQEDGRFSWETRFPDQSNTQTSHGSVRLENGTLAFTFDPGEHGGTLAFDATITGDRLSLAGDIVLESGDFGFEGSNFAIPTLLEMTLRRR